jgi:hypothetical protein
MGTNEIRIQQISPNEFQYLVAMKDNHFTYSTGLGESTCGVVEITSKGYFQSNALHLLETEECVNKNTSTNPPSYIKLRAKK